MRYRWLSALLLLAVWTPAASALSLSGGGGVGNIPPCLDTGGAHLNYNPASGLFCGGSSSGGAPGNAFADGSTKGIVAFPAATFTCSSGICDLQATLGNRTLPNTTTLNIKDTLFTVEDDVDGTKKFRFQVSSVVTGTTILGTLFPADDTFVGLNATQTLNNKILNNAAHTGTTTGIDKTMVGLGNVDNTSDATKNAAVVTLTNKSLSGAANTFSNIPSPAVVFTDVTTGNASTSQHGFLPKLPGVATVYLDGTGAFSTPPGGGGGSPLTVRELDGTPSVANVSVLQVTNGTLTDNGGGVVSVTTGGGGGGGSGTVTTGAPNASARYNAADTTVGPSTGVTLSPTKVLTTYNNIITITSNTILDQHNIVNCLAGGNTVTATLPPTSTTTVGHYTIVKGDTTGICQVAISGSDTFNGGTGPIQLTKQYDAVVVDVWIASSPGVWWYTATKAQWGYVQLNVKGADLPSSNAAIIAVDEPRPKLVFNDVTSWCASWTFALNPDYGVNPQIVYKYTMTSATSGSTKMDWSVWKTTAGQAELAQSPGYDTVNTCTDTAVNAVNGRISQVTCPLTTNDAMVANDAVTIKACRNVTGTATGNLNMISAQLQYFRQ